MKASVFTDEEQLITKAIDVLVKELGPTVALASATPEKLFCTLVPVFSMQRVVS